MEIPILFVNLMNILNAIKDNQLLLLHVPMEHLGIHLIHIKQNCLGFKVLISPPLWANSPQSFVQNTILSSVRTKEQDVLKKVSKYLKNLICWWVHRWRNWGVGAWMKVRVGQGGKSSMWWYMQRGKQRAMI